MKGSTGQTFSGHILPNHSSLLAIFTLNYSHLHHIPPTMEFPTNLTWEIVVNCTCPYPDYNCWWPTVYTKPIECVPSSIDLNQFFNGIHNNNGNGGGNLLAIIGICLQILAFGFAIYSYMALSRFRRQELRHRSRRQELRNENVVEEGQNNANVPPLIRLPITPYPPLAITCSLCRRRQQQQPMPTIEETIEEEGEVPILTIPILKSP